MAIGSSAIENVASDPADIASIRSYLADYRATHAGGRAPRGGRARHRTGRLVDGRLPSGAGNRSSGAPGVDAVPWLESFGGASSAPAPAAPVAGADARRLEPAAGSSGSPSSRTRTAPSGCCSRSGWGGYFVLRTLSGIANAMGWSYVLHTALLTATGYSVTLLMAAAYRRLIRRAAVDHLGRHRSLIVVHRRRRLLGRSRRRATPPSSRPGAAPEGIRFLGAILLTVTLLVAWSALYYGINFYLQVEEQTDQLQRLENQATSAQLAMLRYQLNPHFLFNTLNSISTLVLLKQTERGQCDADPAVLVPALYAGQRADRQGHGGAGGRDAEALSRHRADAVRGPAAPALRDRPGGERARLPSLLLQPLVENAIKYAVTPQEEGAEIASRRKRVDRPGADHRRPTPGPGARPRRLSRREPTSTGVGLANIRDRLAQAYGDDHRFETAERCTARGRRRPGGFRVLIDIPYQDRSPRSRNDHPHHPRRRREARHPGPAAAARSISTTSRSSTPAPTGARRSARSRPTSPTSSSSTSRCRASTASRWSRG